jgi:hypothetical protein
MCITVNRAELSKTKILSLPLESGNHFIAYSNMVQNGSGKPNAMILSIPGVTKPEWFHNTEAYNDFLDEITEKATWNNWVPTRTLGRSAKGMLSFEEFDLGMYTIGLAASFEGAEEFIASLPEGKRPEVSDELRKFFREHNRGWSFAVCCFSSEKTIDAQPIAFEYTPFNPDLLYFPTLDAHNGKAPNLKKTVEADHTFIYEHTGKFDRVLYKMNHIEISDVPSFLNRRRYRLKVRNGSVQNGDTYIRISDMVRVDFEFEPDFYRAAPKPYDGEPLSA